MPERFNASPSPPPVAERRGHVDGDPYAWLRDPNWREATRDPSRLSPAIRRHLEAENAYADSVLEPAADLRRTLFAELKARLKQDDESVPFPDGGYSYYRRYAKGGQHPAYCRRQRGSDIEEVLVDGDREAESSSYFRVARCRHGPGHGLVAFTVDRDGSEHHELLIRDLADRPRPRDRDLLRPRATSSGRRTAERSSTRRSTNTVGRTRCCATVSATTRGATPSSTGNRTPDSSSISTKRKAAGSS